MKTIWGKSLSAFLALTMCLSLLSGAALADGEAETDETAVEEAVETEEPVEAETVETEVPAETEEAVKTEQPEETEEPVVTEEPAETEKPVEAEKLSEAAAVSVEASNADTTASGTCGDNLTWTLENGTLTISGTGAMDDWLSNITPTPWYDYRTSITSVTIGSGVTTIGDWAFYDCTSLTSVTIPAGVTEIGFLAFFCCTGLMAITVADGNENYSSADGVLFNKAKTTLICCPARKGGSYTIPDSVTSIGNDAFYKCTSLTSVTIPASVTAIRDSAFAYCTGLTSVTIPAGVTEIGFNVFACCTGLKSVTIPDGVTVIGQSAFWRCDSLTSVTIPDSVTEIGSYAFCGCTSLTSVTIPDSVTTIGDGAFWNCNKLTGVEIPKSVTAIGGYAFYGCTSLMSVEIPSSVTSIGEEAFKGCTGLTAITVADGNENYSSADGVLFNKAKTTLICCPARKSGSYTIPVGVTSIGEWAFYECTGLKSVTIGSGVAAIGEYAFFNCTSLASVTIPDSVASIGDDAFYSCTGLTDVYYGGSETDWAAISIGNYNTRLTNATIHYNSTGPDTSTGTDTGTVTVYNTGCDKNISFDWDINALIDIGGYDNNVALAGILLSCEIYQCDDSTDAIEAAFDSLHLIDGEYGINYLNGKTRIAVGFKQIQRDGETYNIITAVARGTSGGFNDGDMTDLFTDIFTFGFKVRANNMVGLIEEVLSHNGISLTDPNNRFFLTGHSLGGAAANAAAASLLESGVSVDNLACYTFASPFTTLDNNHQDANIFNIIDSKDPVPTVGQDTSTGLMHAIGGTRYGKDIILARDSSFAAAWYDIKGEDWIEVSNAFQAEGSTAANLGLAVTCAVMVGNPLHYHQKEAYLAHVLAEKVTYSGRRAYKAYRICCPVDVAVYDSQDTLVAEIVDNEVVLAGNEEVIAAVLNEEKYIEITNDEEYHIEITGTDDGTMEYTVASFDGDTIATATKTFSDVSVTDGKQFVSYAAEDITVPDTQLYVVNDEETAISEVMEDGTEISLLLGDVTGDGVINVNDVMMLFQYANKQTSTLAHAAAADVTGDGVINVNDVMRLFQYANKQITSL